MARTTSAAVQGICEVKSSIDLAPFIAAANQLVTDLCGGSGYSAAKLELIERWLAAHFYCVRVPRRQSDKAADTGATYRGKTDMGLNSTLYGQMAMRLDTERNLAVYEEQLTKGQTPPLSMTWLGNEENELETTEL